MSTIFKKFVTSVITLTTFTLGIIGANANAYSCKSFVKAEDTINESPTFNLYETQEEQYERFIRSDFATPAKIEQYKQMMKEHEDILNGNYPTPYASQRVLGVPFYEQSEKNYCGPATVRQIYAYLNNTSYPPSQSVIAKEMKTTSDGTDQQAIIDYLNAHCPATYVTLWKNGVYTSPSGLFNLVISDINSSKPTVAHITGATTSNWRYATSGHYLCFEGYVDDTSTNGHVIHVVDPWLKGHNIANGKYTVSREKAYAVTDRIGS